MRKALLVLLASLAMLAGLSAGAAAGVPAHSVFIGWLDDEHWLAARGGRLLKVAALSGDEQEFFGFDGLPVSTAGPGTLDQEALAERAAAIIAAQKAGTLQESPDAHMQWPLAGPNPFQMVNQKAIGSELSAGSADGKWTAVNRKNDLYLIEKETKKERRLTSDGSDFIFNGRADAVYQEEIFFPARSLRAFWWSPDSAHVAFLRLDDTDVAKFTLINATQRVQTPEITTYPKAGASGPTVKIGIAHVADKPVTWVDLSAYPAKD